MAANGRLDCEHPPNFCNVVGLRTSPGRGPTPPSTLGWFTLGCRRQVPAASQTGLFLKRPRRFDRRSPINDQYEASSRSHGGSEFNRELRL